MKKLLALLAVAALVAGCAAKQPVKEFHPTDDVNSTRRVVKARQVTVLKLILDWMMSQQMVKQNHSTQLTHY